LRHHGGLDKIVGKIKAIDYRRKDAGMPCPARGLSGAFIRASDLNWQAIKKKVRLCEPNKQSVCGGL
jgi:hypothetical protein